MIARIWRGAVRRKDADAYARDIRDTGLVEYTGDERYLIGESTLAHYQVVDPERG